MINILVADRDGTRSREKTDLLRDAGWQVASVRTPADMLSAMAAGSVSLLLLDSNLAQESDPPASGDLVLKVKEQHPEVMVLHTFPKDHKSLVTAADGLLCEPIEPAMLMVVTKSLLKLQAAEQALRISETRLKLAQEAAGLATVDWDLQTGIAVWSPRLSALLGIDSGATSGSPSWPALLERLHDDDRERIADTYTDLRQSGGRFENEFRIVGTDGVTRWLAARGEFCLDEEGSAPERMVGVVFDVTARKHAEESNALLAAVVSSSGDAIVSFDIDSRIISLNAAAESLLGYTAAEVVGRHAAVYVPDSRSDERAEFLKLMANGKSVEAQTVRMHKNGTPVHVWLRGSPILSRSGQLIGFSGIYRDMTEARHREHHIRSLLRELSHRSKNLMAVIQSMARHSLISTPSPEDFVAKFIERLRSLSASHDLLSADDWRGASLSELIRLQMQYHADWLGVRIRVNGPTVVLLPAAAQTIGMAVHELLANALRYGSLSEPRGRVEISWDFREANGPVPMFHMEWREFEGPTVSPATHKGFGHTVVGRVTGQALGGMSALELSTSGASWMLDAPSSAIVRRGDDYEANLADAGRSIVG